MTTFRRTVSGLSNLHLFFRVDKVVYCEGGQNIDLRAVVSGEGDETTLDTMFWSYVCSFLGAGKKYHFKSVGGKEMLQKLAEDVVQAGVVNVIICRDSDFSDLQCCKVQHPSLAYTHGYSWENDVCDPDVIVNLLKRQLPVDRKSEALASNLRRQLDKLPRLLAKWCEVDLALVSKGKGAFFVRSAPIAQFDDTAAQPRMNNARARGRLGVLGYKRCPPRKIKVHVDSVLRHTCGKTVSALAYHLFVGHVTQREPRFRMSLDMFLRQCISSTIDEMRRGRCIQLAGYYCSYRATFP